MIIAEMRKECGGTDYAEVYRRLVVLGIKSDMNVLGRRRLFLVSATYSMHVCRLRRILTTIDDAQRL